MESWCQSPPIITLIKSYRAAKGSLLEVWKFLFNGCELWWQNKSKLCSFLSGLVWASGNSVIWTKMGQVLIREERFIRGCLVFTVLYKGTLAQIDALNISLVLFWFMRTIEKDGNLLNRLSVLERWKGDVLFWYILETNGQEWMQEQKLNYNEPFFRSWPAPDGR